MRKALRHIPPYLYPGNIPCWPNTNHPFKSLPLSTLLRRQPFHLQAWVRRSVSYHPRCPNLWQLLLLRLFPELPPLLGTCYPLIRLWSPIEYRLPTKPPPTARLLSLYLIPESQVLGHPAVTEFEVHILLARPLVGHLLVSTHSRPLIIPAGLMGKRRLLLVPCGCQLIISTIRLLSHPTQVPRHTTWWIE